MKFSIILATLNRSELVFKSVISILNQTYSDYEIIIIDQSNNSSTEKIIKNICNEKILYYRVNFKGLSLARNYGIDKSSGDYICLMDDDAEYEENFLNEANRILGKFDYDILSGLIKDRITNQVFIPSMSEINSTQIKYNNIDLCCSASLVINKKRMVSCVGYFDENMGVGAYFGAGEQRNICSIYSQIQFSN